jgi:uncharacterized protein involved in outer membrane biogenesis
MITASARKIAFLGIPLIGLIVLALVLFNLNRIIERNKKVFLSQAEQTLGRKLSAESIRVSFWNGIKLRLKNFVISDDPDFSAGSFLRAGELDISLKFLPLLKRDLQIERVTLHNPEIAIIRDEEGVFNFSSIGKPERLRGTERKAAEHGPGRESGGGSPLLLSWIDVTGGKLRYIDKKERMNLPLSEIDFSVEEWGPERPFVVRLSAAFLTDKPNLKVEARVGPLDSGLALVDIPLDALVTIDPLDGDKLKAAAPRLKSHLPGGLDFSGLFTLKNMHIKGTLRELKLSGILDPGEAH